MSSRVFRVLRLFGWGAASVWRALRFILSVPALRWRALLPILVLPFAVIGGGVLVMLALEAGTHQFWPGAGPWVNGLVGVAGVALGVVVGMVVTYGVCGAVTETIAHHQLEALGIETVGRDPALAAVRRSLGVALAGLAVALVGWLVLLVVNLVLPPIVVVTAPLGLLVTGLVLAWEIFDFPMAARRMGWRQRLAWFRAHLAEVSGLAVALGLLLATPFLDLLVLPVAVAAAARLLVGESGYDEVHPEE